MRLKDKIITVTGGSGLIGKEIIEYLVKEGAVAINAEIAVETDWEKWQVHCDITSKESVASMIDAVINRYEKIDGLVNNAYPRTKDWGLKFEDVPYESWKKNVDMQMNSVFLLCQKILGCMVRQKSGSIVNIASIYGVVGNDFTLYEGLGMTSAAAYSAIKGGIINFSRYLASLYGKENIRVNCVSPGGIFDNQNPIFVERYNAKVPMRRMGTPEDIAPAVSFLLSDEAKYITGQNLIVDGGWTAI
ncbi:MAG: SDR family oxidoreductase [Prevotellaceae bacterium]|jgi:NAD(P)-dependent dehydrogenase (short-subunit alcohol dehydrogenase family)|nr:SDR family oxidoreductase [Prevotellaceae bacterium]